MSWWWLFLLWPPAAFGVLVLNHAAARLSKPRREP